MFVCRGAAIFSSYQNKTKKKKTCKAIVWKWELKATARYAVAFESVLACMCMPKRSTLHKNHFSSHPNRVLSVIINNSVSILSVMTQTTSIQFNYFTFTNEKTKEKKRREITIYHFNREIRTNLSFSLALFFFPFFLLILSLFFSFNFYFYLCWLKFQIDAWLNNREIKNEKKKHWDLIKSTEHTTRFSFKQKLNRLTRMIIEWLELIIINDLMVSSWLNCIAEVNVYNRLLI